MLKKEILTLPKIRGIKEGKNGEIVAKNDLKNIGKIDFYEKNRIRPDSAGSWRGSQDQNAELLDGYENHESKIITPGVHDHGVRKGLQVETNGQHRRINTNDHLGHVILDDPDADDSTQAQ